MTMKQSLAMLVALMAVVTGGVQVARSADVNATITTRAVQYPVGSKPQVGYVAITAAAPAAASGTLSFDLPVANGDEVLFFNGATRDATGTVKLLTMTRSGTAVTVTDGLSNTLANGDVIQGVVIYK